VKYRQVTKNSDSLAGRQSKVQSIEHKTDMSLKVKYRSQKLNHNHLSPLMEFILLNAGDGIERGQIVEKFYGLERRYCGWYTDPCFTPKEKRDYEHRYRRIQPVVTRALNRLAVRGLVQLIRRGLYVKEIRLTSEGKSIAQHLKGNEDMSSKSK